MDKLQSKVNIDPEETWLSDVEYSHSGSKSTRDNYVTAFHAFKEFIGKTAQGIVDDYDNVSEKTCRRMYSQYIKAFIGKLRRDNYTPNTINTWIGAIKSFFMHNDLPLAYIPSGSKLVIYHNRPIEKDEIMAVLAASSPREKAFFTMMVQSGARPSTLCKLQVKDIKPDMFIKSDEEVYIVNVPEAKTKGAYNKYFTFIGQDTIKALRSYIAASRPNITSESLLFTCFGSETKPANSKTFSILFARTLKQLKALHIVNYEESKAGKPNELRLYTLRKYFRNNAAKAGPDYVNYWMGHLSAMGVDLHYFGKDEEKHKERYKLYALPYLRLESHTPTEAVKAMFEKAKKVDELEQIVAESQKQIADLNHRLKILTDIVETQWKNMSKEAANETANEIEEKTKAKTAAKLAKKSESNKSGND